MLEKDGYLSQFAGSHELEVPFKSDNATSHFSQYRKLAAKTFTCQWHPKSRENLELGNKRISTGTEVPAFTFGQTGCSISSCPSSPYVLVNSIINIGNSQHFYSSYRIRHSPWQADKCIFGSCLGHSGRTSLPGFKRSRSSENLRSLAPVEALQYLNNSQFQPSNPLKFSITAPNSSLFTSKFYDSKTTHSELSALKT